MIEFMEEDRQALRDAAALLEYLYGFQLETKQEAMYLSGRLAGLAGRPDAEEVVGG